jgi:hypothetical protein
MFIMRSAPARPSLEQLVVIGSRLDATASPHATSALNRSGTLGEEALSAAVTLLRNAVNATVSASVPRWVSKSTLNPVMAGVSVWIATSAAAVASGWANM